jgi:hypothetical protein
MACLPPQATSNVAPHSSSTMRSTSSSFVSYSGGATTIAAVAHVESAERETLAFPYSIHTDSGGPIEINAKTANCFQRQHTMPTQIKAVQKSPFSRLPPASNSPYYNRARRPALIPHTSSLNLADASEIISRRIGAPILPPPDPQRLSYLTSNTSDPGLSIINNSVSELLKNGEPRNSKKRKHSALLLNDENNCDCGTPGCGDSADIKHLSSMSRNEEELSVFEYGSLFVIGKASYTGCQSAGDVSPLSPTDVIGEMSGVEI